MHRSQGRSIALFFLILAGVCLALAVFFSAVTMSVCPAGTTSPGMGCPWPQPSWPYVSYSTAPAVVGVLLLVTGVTLGFVFREPRPAPVPDDPLLW
jgi:hypothetical protein